MDSKGCSALLLASAYSRANREEAVISLLHGGANPFLEDNTARKAMDYARNNTRLTNTHARTMLAQYSDRSTGLYKTGATLPAQDAPEYSAPEPPIRNGSPVPTPAPEPSRPGLPQEEPPLRTAPAVITTDGDATAGSQARNGPPPGSPPEEATQTVSPSTVKPEPPKPESPKPEPQVPGPETIAAIDWEQWTLKIFGLIAVLVGLAIAVIKYRTAVLESKTKRASLNK